VKNGEGDGSAGVGVDKKARLLLPHALADTARAVAVPSREMVVPPLGVLPYPPPHPLLLVTLVVAPPVSLDFGETVEYPRVLVALFNALVVGKEVNVPPISAPPPPPPTPPPFDPVGRAIEAAPLPVPHPDENIVPLALQVRCAEWLGQALPLPTAVFSEVVVKEGGGEKLAVNTPDTVAAFVAEGLSDDPNESEASVVVVGEAQGEVLEYQEALTV